MMPFTEHGTQTCILKGTSIDGVLVLPVEVPLLIALFLSGPSLSPVRCHTHSVSFSEPPQAKIPLRSVSPVSDSTDLCTYCHHPAHSMWTVMLFHLDPQLFITPWNKLLAPPIPLPVPVSWQYYHMPLPRCYLVWWVFLPPVHQVDGPAEPLPDVGAEDNDDEDCIITDYSPLTRQYTILDMSNSKGLKAILPTTLANKLVAEGQVGTLKLKVLLSKHPFISLWSISTSKNVDMNTKN